MVFSFPVFFDSFVREFHAGRGAISLAFTIHNVVSGISAIFIGRVADRLGPRKVILSGLALLALMLFSASAIGSELWQLYGWYLAVGVVGPTTTTVPYALVVSRWFDRQRGQAIGLMMGGFGTGAIAMPLYERNGVTITAFLVTHGRVKPSYGYRLDYAGRGVAISGDTSPSDNLVAFCKGVDVLIHEAIDPELLRQLVASQPVLDAIVARHTTPEQAAAVFSRVLPRLAVFSHSPGTAAIVEQTKRSYSGRVEMGTDLMVINIGDEVRVTQAAADVRAR